MSEKNRISLVVARFNEDLEWLLRLPDNVAVFVYNKGEPISDPALLQRVASIKQRPNVGRESETYLSHIRDGGVHENEYTVFTQGIPFEHSPDFLKLLNSSNDWQPVQPLSVRWLESHQIPPSGLLVTDPGESADSLNVRSEIFCLRTLGPISFFDEGTTILLRQYLAMHRLPNGSNIASHFLRSAGWVDLAEEAEASDFGQFSYGGIFAVKTERLSRIPINSLDSFLLMSRSHHLNAYIFERLWLHFFGLRFHPRVLRHRTHD